MTKEYPPELNTINGESLRDTFYGLGINCEGSDLEDLPFIASKASQYLSRPIPNDLFYRLVFWGQHEYPDSQALAAILMTLTEQSENTSWEYLYSIFDRRPLTIQYLTQPDLEGLHLDRYLVILERQDEPIDSKMKQVIIRRRNKHGEATDSFDTRFIAHSQTGEYLRIDPPNRRYRHIARSIMSGKSSRIYIEPMLL